MKKRFERGVTFVSLVIVIVVLLILASITISAGIISINGMQDDALESELKMINHAVLERYTKWQILHDESLLVGDPVGKSSEVQEKIDKTESGATCKIKYDNTDNLKSEKKYYKLTTSQLAELGIYNIDGDREYYVNYFTGEVVNTIISQTKNSKKPLYIASRDDEAIPVSSNNVEAHIKVYYGENLKNYISISVQKTIGSYVSIEELLSELGIDKEGYSYDESKKIKVNDIDVENEILFDDDKDIKIYFKTNKYKFTLVDVSGFDLNDSSESGDYLYGAKIRLAPRVYKGYNFIRWEVDGSDINIQTSKGDFNMPARDVVIKPIVEPISYEIDYELNGGTVSEENPKTYTIETDTFTLKNPVRAGYTFVGWTGTGVNGVNDDVTIEKGKETGNKSFTAQWSPNENTQYKVIHKKMDLNGKYEDEQLFDVQILKGTTDSTVNPDVKNYVGFESPSKESIIIDGNGEAELIYEYKRNMYKFKVESDSGLTITESSKSGDYYFEAPITLKANARDGYEFEIWESSNTNLVNDVSEANKVINMPAGDIVMTAKSKTIPYTITYDLNGGELPADVTNPVTYQVITPTFTLNNPKKVGYVFAGWTGSNGTTPELTVTIPTGSTGNRNYTANWKANTYTVEYYQGQTKLTSSEHTYNENKALLAYAGTPPTGYTFAGWATEGNTSGSSANATTATTRTYTDKQVVNNLTASANGTVKIYAVFSRILTIKSGAAGETSEDKVQYYNPYSNTLVSAISVPAPTEITNWTAIGYRPDSKAENNTLGNGTAGNITPAYNSESTIYAVYNRTITLHSGVNMGTSSTATQYYNSANNVSAISAPAPAEIPNWTAIGYRTDTNADDKNYAVTTEAANISPEYTTGNDLYAVYSRLLTISYNGNGSDGGSTANTTKIVYLNTNSTATSSQEITLADNGFTKTGYTFSGKWAAGSATGTEYNVGAKYNAGLAYNESTFGTTMYAKWTVNQYDYDLNYNVDGTWYGRGYPGSGTNDIYTGVKIGNSDKGYVADLIGKCDYGTSWEIYGFKFNGVTIPCSKKGTMGLTNPLNVYLNTITFNVSNSEYGSVDSEKLIVVPNTTYTTNGNKLTLSDNRVVTATTKAVVGHTVEFVNWSSTSGTINQATTVTANFKATANTYKITLDNKQATSAGTTEAYYQYNTSKVINDVRVYYYTDSALTHPLDNGYKIVKPAKTGYTFMGYYSEENGGGTQYVDENGTFINNIYKTDGNKTLYARWEEKVYQVTYNYSENGGTSATKTTDMVKYGSAIDLTPTATKSGWTFVGWNTNKDATTKLDSLIMGADGVTLYAIYSKTVTATCNYYNEQVATVDGTFYNKATSVSVKLPVIENVTKDGVTYSGRGWTKDNTNANVTTNVASGGSVTLSSNATYYASYQAEITGTFYYATGNGSTDYTWNNLSQESKTATATKYMNYKGIFVESNFTVPTEVTASNAGAAAEKYMGVSIREKDSTVVTPTTANTVFYAVYAENLTLYYYNGTEHTSKIIVRRMLSSGATGKYSVSVSEEVVPVAYDGASFVTWSYSQTNAGTSYRRTPTTTGNNVLYAIYEKQMTSTFNYYDKTTSTSKTANANATKTYISKAGGVNTIHADFEIPTTVTSSSGPENTSYSHVAITKEGTEINPTTENTTYYAVYSKEVIATKYVYNNTTTTASKGTAYGYYDGTTANASINLGTVPAVDGYTARGWSTSDTANATVLTNNIVSILNNTNYYASYSYQVKLTYASNGGTGTAPAAQTATACMNYKGTKANASFTIATSSLTKTDETQVAWNSSTTGAGTIYKYGDKVGFAANTTIYAMWMSATNPSNVAVKSGTAVTFSVTGTNASTYQWYVADATSGVSTTSVGNGKAITGATSSSYTIPAASVLKALDGKYYYCVVKNNNNTTAVYKTASAKLTVYYAQSVKALTDLAIKQGESASFDATASGGNPTNYTYKWYWTNTNSNANGTQITASTAGATISGQTSAVLSLNNVNRSWNNYYVYCETSNGQYTVKSNVAKLTVYYPPVVSGANNVTAAAGKPANFEVSVTDSNPAECTYQWYTEKDEMPGSKSGFTVTKMSEAEGTFYRANFTKTTGTTSAWNYLSFAHYSFEPGKSYTIHLKIRMQSKTNGTNTQIRHSAVPNDYWTSGCPRTNIENGPIGEWKEYTLTRVLDETYTKTDGTVFDTNPLIEIYTGDLKLTDTITSRELTFDYKDIYVEETETGKRVMDASGTAIAGATNSSYSFQATSALDGTGYYCVVNNGKYTVQSNVGYLTSAGITGGSVKYIVPGGQVTLTPTRSGSVGTINWTIVGSTSNITLSAQTGNSITVTAKTGSVEGTYQVKATDSVTGSNTTYTIEVISMTISPTSCTLTLPNAKTQGIVVTKNGNVGTVSYESSNTAVATVSSDGTITGVSKGTCTITVKEANANITKTCSVTVNRSKITVPSSPTVKTFNTQEQSCGITTPTGTSVVTGSTTAATNAGTYSVTYKLNDTTNYEWNDGTITNKTVQWKISRINDVNTMYVNASETGKEVTITGTNMGTLSILTAPDATKAIATIDNTTKKLKVVGKPGATGTTKVVVKEAAGGATVEVNIVLDTILPEWDITVKSVS